MLLFWWKTVFYVQLAILLQTCLEDSIYGFFPDTLLNWRKEVCGPSIRLLRSFAKAHLWPETLKEWRSKVKGTKLFWSNSPLPQRRDWETDCREEQLREPKNLFWRTSHLPQKMVWNWETYMKRRTFGGALQKTFFEEPATCPKEFRKTTCQFAPRPLLLLKTPKLTQLGEHGRHS